MKQGDVPRVKTAITGKEAAAADGTAGDAAGHAAGDAAGDAAEDGSVCTPQTLRARAFLLLQEKWVLFIVNGLLGGPLGFNELGRRASGVNTTTLSQRMDLLEREGIVTRTVHATIPPRTSYELTAKGQALRTVIEAIDRWSQEHVP